MLTALLILPLCACSTAQYRASTLAGYEQAAVINDWTLTLEIDGATANLTAVSGPHGNATLQYSDESDARTVYQYADYLYVSEIRHGSNSVLYVKASGIAMGIWPETVIIPFDLKNRNRLDPVRIKD